MLCVVYVLVHYVDVMLSGVEAQGQTRASAAHEYVDVMLSAVEAQGQPQVVCRPRICGLAKTRNGFLQQL